MKRVFAFGALLYSGQAEEEGPPKVCRLGDDFDDGTPCVAEGDVLLQTKRTEKHSGEEDFILREKHEPGEEGDPPPEADVNEMRSC